MSYLSNENIARIGNKVAEILCMTEHPNSEFIRNLVGLMQDLSRKYDTNDLNIINNVTINKAVDRFGPQYRVKHFIETNNKQIMTTGELPPSKILRQKLSGVTQLGQKTALPRGKRQVSVPAPIETDAPYQQALNPFTTVRFMQNPEAVEAKPEFGPNFYYNKESGLFYNKNYEVIHEPEYQRYFDAKTGKQLDSSDPKANAVVFFNKSKTPIDNVRGAAAIAIDAQQGKPLAFYDVQSGQLIPRGPSSGAISSRKSVADSGSGAWQNVRLGDTKVVGETLIKEYTISVDSRHRDVKSFPNSNRYQIILRNTDAPFGSINNLDEPIRNIVRIELVGGIVPNVLADSPSSSPDTYFLLALDEIVGQYRYSSSVAKNIFGKLQFDLDLPFTANYLDVEPVRCIREFVPEPLSTPLNSITINILNFNGNAVNFGSDTVKIRYWSTLGTTTTTFILTWIPHGLTTGDIVYFRDTINANLDDAIDGIGVTVLAPTLISVPVDSSAVAAGIAPNMFGPPVNPDDPLNSPGQPFPTVPPNDPNNPTDFFGFILKPDLQNSFTFKITSEEKNPSRVGLDELATKVSSY